MRIYLIISVLIFILNIISCKQKKQFRKYRTIEKNGVTIRGYVIADTLFDDTVYHYNSDGILLLKEFYANGKLNNLSEEFYSNGKVRTQTSYSNGLKNGINRYYDSSGRQLYSDYYYYNLPVGPIVYYNKSDVANRFFFISFDNRTLLDINYASWKGVNDFALNFINYSYELEQADSVKQAALFLYLIHPPKFLTKYSLYKRNKKNQDDQTFVTTFSSEQPFISYTLPILKDEFHYSIQLDIFDSIVNKRTIINREVW